MYVNWAKGHEVYCTVLYCTVLYYIVLYAVFFQFPLLLPGVVPREEGGRGDGGGHLAHGLKVLYQVVQVF